MLLHGSCHCGAVRFTIESDTVFPFMRCYCAICRKTAGAGGYAINIMGKAETLRVRGKRHVKTYRPWMDFPERTERSEGLRHFCGTCGSPLWVSDRRWPELIHPHASAIDTPLPIPPEVNHVLLDYKASWVEIPRGPRHHRFPDWPDDSIHGWHKRRRLLGKG
jgi:hypothetical protein